MFEIIDRYLNRITMYRLMLYYLTALVLVAVFFSAVGLLNFKVFYLIAFTAVLILTSWLTNLLLAKIFQVQTNIESVYITAFILVLIITPPQAINFKAWFFPILAAVLAQASKYILTINKQHLFNPVAVAVAITSISLKQGASWWAGTAIMLPFVIIGGALIARKIRRGHLVLSFILVTLVGLTVSGFMQGNNILNLGQKIFIDSPLLFFAFIMLTEPQTSPPTKNLRIVYGGLVGFLFASPIPALSLFFTPELALLAGNIFSCTVGFKKKIVLKLKSAAQMTADTMEFIFIPDRKFSFSAGQYLEYTLRHSSPDSRGNRRYFTISSSPTETEIKLGIKTNNPSSSFKTALLKMKPGDQLVAGQLAGDFTLPKNKFQKLVFMAGGIGITPFASMVKYLIDNDEHRDITLLYSNRTTVDIAYKNLFNAAAAKVGLKTIYILTRPDQAPPDWKGQLGYITPSMIKNLISDHTQRHYHISGPQRLVDSLDKILSQCNIPKKQIKKDLFPGF